MPRRCVNGPGAGHTRVVPLISLAQDQLPGAARRAVSRACLIAATGPVCAEAATLLTSEVVTNALVHGRGEVRLSVDARDAVLHVEVGDDEPRHPHVPAPGELSDPLAEGGRGMRIVALLSSDWGVRDRSGGGKAVWFEVPVHP